MILQPSPSTLLKWHVTHKIKRTTKYILIWKTFKAPQISRKASMLLQSTLDNKCMVVRSEIKARRTAEGCTVHSQWDHGQASPQMLHGDYLREISAGSGVAVYQAELLPLSLLNSPLHSAQISGVSHGAGHKNASVVLTDWKYGLFRILLKEPRLSLWAIKGNDDGLTKKERCGVLTLASATTL